MNRESLSTQRRRKIIILQSHWCTSLTGNMSAGRAISVLGTRSRVLKYHRSFQWIPCGQLVPFHKNSEAVRLGSTTGLRPSDRCSSKRCLATLVASPTHEFAVRAYVQRSHMALTSKGISRGLSTRARNEPVEIPSFIGIRCVLVVGSRLLQCSSSLSNLVERRSFIRSPDAVGGNIPLRMLARFYCFDSMVSLEPTTMIRSDTGVLCSSQHVSSIYLDEMLKTRVSCMPRSRLTSSNSQCTHLYLPMVHCSFE